MSNTVKFSATRLAAAGKKGVILPDSDGYYETIIGGLNIFNSAGQFYTLEGARSLFTGSGAFMRRIQRGALRAEVGHPKMEPGMSMNDYIGRLMEIRETNTCGQFKEIWLDFDRPKALGEPNAVAIMGKVIPSGPFGPMLQKAFENGGENVCFSVRGTTNDYYERGVYTRELTNIITFDYVNEPGIHIAEKYKSPSLETYDEKTFTRSQVERALFANSSPIMATESSREIALGLFKSMGWELPEGIVPSYTNW